MRIKIICVGKLKESFYREACAEFIKRLALQRVELIEIKDSTPEKEANEMMKLFKSEFIVVLDAQGKKKTSEDFAHFLKTSEKDIAFVIGGPYGISPELKKAADFVLSLSDFTFPHELARLIFLEQVYRAFSINQNKKYHK